MKNIFLSALCLLTALAVLNCGSSSSDKTNNSTWTSLTGASGVETVATGIAVDSSGNSYVTGYTEIYDLQATDATIDPFVIIYDTDGATKTAFTKLTETSAVEIYGCGIAVDSSGNYYVTGYTYGTIDSQVLTGSADAFVMKYNSSGERQWTKLAGAYASITSGNSIALDSSGNPYITGFTSGSLGGQSLTGTMDAFVTYFNASGEAQWTRLLGASGAVSYASAIAVDSGGTSYVAGLTYGNFNGQSLTGTKDAFVTTGFNK